MVNSAMVSTGFGFGSKITLQNHTKIDESDITTRQNSNTSTRREANIACNNIQFGGLTDVSDTTNLILQASLRDSTKKKYNSYHKRWIQYCQDNDVNPITPNIANVLEFLSSLFDKGLSYSAINAAKSALSHSILIPPYKKLSDHPLIAQYGKGVYNLRPPKPKLQFVWDVKIVFDYLQAKGTNEKLQIKELSQKLLILLLLLGGQRMNSIFNFDTDNMFINTECAVFNPSKVLKHSQPGNKLDQFTYRSFPQKELCVVECLKEYVARRELKVGKEITKLFISLSAPYHGVSIDTLRRWIYDLFSGSELLKTFTPHSCRSAATSKAKKLNVDMEEILKQGCWKNMKTFKKYYDKEIIYFAKDDVDFMRIIK